MGFTIYDCGCPLHKQLSNESIFGSSENQILMNMLLNFQERTGSNSFDHNSLTLQYKLDNEFELIFVVAFQKILQLAYVDKFLSDIHLEFRDKYKNELSAATSRNFQKYDFSGEFHRILESAEDWGLYLHWNII